MDGKYFAGNRNWDGETRFDTRQLRIRKAINFKI
jgi:hypothetical protein